MPDEMGKAKPGQTTRYRHGSKAFRPRARVLKALGQDLIQNEAIAIAELVKNAYDADAENVWIEFTGDLKSASGKVIIRDDGNGMDTEIIENTWMEPATISKIRSPISPNKKRRVTGEKGIGRFASGTIGSTLNIVSRPRGLVVEVVASIDWGRFNNENLYLDQVKIKWFERERPKSQPNGTELTISGLNKPWPDEIFKSVLENLQTQLMRLVSPFRTKDDFSIYIKLPERLQNNPLFRPLHGKIEPSPVYSYPIYRAAGEVDGKGNVTGKIWVKGEEHHLRGPKDTDLTLHGATGRKPECGPFSFDLRVWNRDKDSIEEVAEASGVSKLNVRRDITAAQGISIYRDDFRIQTPDSDWLGLDLRRVQNPTARISQNQVVGVVYVSAVSNLGIIDQTNRQALKDNTASRDLRHMTLQLVQRLEAYRAVERSKPRDEIRGIFRRLDFAGVQSYIENNYSSDKQLLKIANEFKKSLDVGTREAQDVISRYRRLATLGQVFDRLVHDGRHPVGRLANQAEKLRKMAESQEDISHNRLKEVNRRIEEELMLLGSLFDRIAPLSGRQRGRPASTDVVQLVRNTGALIEHDLQIDGINIQLPSEDAPFKPLIDCYPGDIQAAIINLIQNAMYWCSIDNPRGDREISVDVVKESSGASIIVSDNGPGVHEDFHNTIWEPYVSLKENGIGLGLSIVGETMADHGGEALLKQNGPLRGATFALYFPEAY